MGDIIIALSAIAAAFALYHRIMAGRALKRLLALLEKEKSLRDGQQGPPQ